MHVPLLDLRAQYATIKSEVEAAIEVRVDVLGHAPEPRQGKRADRGAGVVRNVLCERR